MKPTEREKTDVKLICGTCGKPISDKPRSSVTRWLFQESRCNCLNPDISMVEPEQSSPSLQPDSTSPAAEIEDEIKKNLGDKYEVLSLVGRGGMGAVYKVRDKNLHKTFAIKVLNSNLVEDKSSVKRFEQEARAASHLTHPNLVAVYDFGMGGGGAPFLVMDYLDGTSLAELIGKEGFIDAPRALDIFIQVVEAVAHAHLKGVIHRDIKPNNIIVTRAENGTDFVKLIDFGIAKVLPSEARATQNLTQTGEIFGSPLYMSPEQCQGQKLDARSDIYGIGCVMYEALTGRPPFEGDNPIQTILKHINESPVPINTLKQDYQIPKDLERLILRCLEKEPADRYQSAHDLLKDLEHVRDGKPIKITKLRRRGAGKKAVLVRALAILAILSSLSMIAMIWLGMNQRTQAPFAPPIAGTGPRDPLTDAQRLDQLSYHYFTTGDYERAIPLLEFGIKTYQQNGKRLGQGGEDSYLADNYQHIGKCYLMLKKFRQSVPYYQKSLAIYRKFGNYSGGMMPEAVKDYATALRAIGRTSEAELMTKEFATTGNLSTIP